MVTESNDNSISEEPQVAQVVAGRLHQVIHAQALLWKVTFIPVPATLIFLGLCIWVFTQIEYLAVGVSHADFFFNSTSLEKFCFGQSGAFLFKGVDFLVAIFMGHGLYVLYVAFVVTRFRKRAMHRFAIEVLMTGVLTAIPLALRKEDQVIVPGLVLILSFLEAAIPDAILALRSRGLALKWKRTVVACSTAVVMISSTYLVICFLFFALHWKSSFLVEVIVLGLLYPFLSLSCRFMVRNMGRKLARRLSKNGDIQRESLRVQRIINETLVNLFALPGFFSIFMLDDNAGFLTSIATQLVMEPIGAFAFVRFRRSQIYSQTSRLVSEKKNPIQRVTPLSNQITILDLEEFERTAWEGLILSEEIGEKRAMIMASILTLVFRKDLTEYLWRLLFGMAAETLADVLKIRVYIIAGLVDVHMHPKMDIIHVPSALLTNSLAIFYCLSSIFIGCSYS